LISQITAHAASEAIFADVGPWSGEPENAAARTSV
jgi:hypothetical protein